MKQWERSVVETNMYGRGGKGTHFANSDKDAQIAGIQTQVYSNCIVTVILFKDKKVQEDFLKLLTSKKINIKFDISSWISENSIYTEFFSAHANDLIQAIEVFSKIDSSTKKFLRETFGLKIATQTDILPVIKEMISDEKSVVEIIKTIEEEYSQDVYPGLLYEVGQYYQTKEDSDLQAAISCYEAISEANLVYYKKATEEIISAAMAIQDNSSTDTDLILQMQKIIFSRFLKPVDERTQQQLDKQFDKLAGKNGIATTFRNVGSPEYFIQMADYVKQSEEKFQTLEKENQSLKKELASLKRELEQPTEIQSKKMKFF